MFHFPCVLFAGGKSSRMGQDKSLLPFGGFETLAEFQYTKLQKLFTQVYIATKDPSKFSFNALFIEDKYEVFAPTAGFLSIYETLHVEKFFVLGVDMPFVNAEAISSVIKADATGVDATVAKTKNSLEALCGVYHRSLENKFKEMEKNNIHKLQYLLKNSHTKTVYFEDENLFFNLNKPYEYQKAKQLYAIINS
jgi:molybdopterin-guanine dinucleotide biosynthesis protein A